MNDDTNANDDDDDIRATSVVMLGDSIEDATPLLDVATSIEDAVYSQFPSSLYKQKIRFLVANLQRNELLRTKVRAGTIQAIDLIQMTDEEFMTDAMRVKIESIRRRMDKRSERAVFADGIESDSYICKECKNRKTKFIHLSDTRDVRKAETWGGSSADDESKVMVVCMECKHEWGCSIL